MRHQVSGVCTSREASSGGASAQQLGWQWRWMSMRRCPAWMLASERMASTAFSSARFVAGQLGRQAQFDRQAVAQAERDQHALGQQPRRAVEHGGRAERAHVVDARVDHQRRRPVAADEAAPGQVDRLARRARFGQAGALHLLQPLQRRQALGTGQARQRGGQGGGRRHRAGQRGGVGVEPVRQQAGWAARSRRGSFMAAPSLAARRLRRARSAHSVRGAGRAPRWPGRRTGSR